MTREQIKENLKEIILTIKPRTDISKVTEETSLVRDLGVDSLSMLLLSLAVENKFGFQFTTQEPFNTVGEVIEYIEKVVG